MIVPMKKVSLIIMGDKKAEALETLRRLGIMHIEISEGSGERLVALKEQITLLESGIFTVGKKKKAPQEDIGTAEALAVAAELAALSEEKKALLAERAGLTAELDRLKGWGAIDPAAIAALAQDGIDLAFYACPRKEYAALPDILPAVRLGCDKGTVRFLLRGPLNEEQTEAAASLSDYRLTLPSSSTAAMAQRLETIAARIGEIDARIAACIAYADAMAKAVKVLEKDVEFEVYATGMDDEALSADSDDPLSVACFSGYVEAENLGALRQAAADNAWALIADDPTVEDNVPTKLKNNRFVSLIYPLTDFLGTVPGYFEYDISGWFLAFILIFFGIIFGDGGYGLLICAIAALPILKAVFSKKAIPPTYLLIGLFGLSTVVWGTLTCTWFGLSAETLPQWLQGLSIPFISNVYADKIWYPFWTQGAAGLTTAQNLQIFCFSLALVQLTVAHIMGAVRNRRSPKLLGDIGSALQLIGMYYLVLSLVVNPQVFSFDLVIAGIPVGTVAIALIGVGFLLSFVFANYEGSLLKSILASVVNIVSVLLGVVNVFSDIVSYIRLWAVGLAGAAISATVNELAGPLLGNFLFMILAIVLLVFGHGLNMILNILSVIVHGIRLNTLEFSSHLDMSWSGHKFKPFNDQIDYKGESL